MTNSASPRVQTWWSGAEGGFPEQCGNHTGTRPARCSGRGRSTSTRSLRAAAAAVWVTGGAGSFWRHLYLCFQTHRCLSFSKEQYTNLPIPHEYYFKLLNQQGHSVIPIKGKKKSNTERNHVNPCKTRAVLQGFRRSFPGTEGLGRSLE